jgi:phosphatidylinositol alpha 1,6-mannosyltransferase
VLEAMASGLPTVVVDRGGPQDLVEPGETGFVARANDVVDLADRAERLLRDPAERERMAAAAHAAAAERDWERINGRLLESYRQLLAARPPSRGRTA